MPELVKMGEPNPFMNDSDCYLPKIKDSGTRREFGTGSVRDCAEGKGRCDLLPLDIISVFINYDVSVGIKKDLILIGINQYIRCGNKHELMCVIHLFIQNYFPDAPTAFIEVSKQYEDGCIKYGDRNWEKGIPLHCYIDSGTRHYLKFLRGDKDEHHDRAFLWNMLGAIWTHENKPEMIDLPFNDKGE